MFCLLSLQKLQSEYRVQKVTGLHLKMDFSAIVFYHSTLDIQNPESDWSEMSTFLCFF